MNSRKQRKQIYEESAETTIRWKMESALHYRKNVNGKEAM